MENKELPKLTDEELLQEQKKIKSSNIINATLIGLLVGIAIYSVIKNGLGFFIFFPLFFAFLLAKKIKQINK